MKIQILEPEGFPAEAAGRLSEVGEVTLGPWEGTGPRPFDAVFIRLARQIDAGFHADYPDLRWIISPTTGLNHLDLTYLERAGVKVLSLKGRTEFLDTIHATAELTIGLALALIRDIPRAASAVHQGVWDRYPHKGRELHGKRVMILGYGRIGRLVAPVYQAFGCKVLAHDVIPGRVPTDLACQFPEDLAKTDLLSIHLPLEDATRQFVDAGLLAQLPPRAVVINTARGEVIDQEALIAGLESGQLSGAALDVLAAESDPVSAELVARLGRLGRRILVTPHIGGFTHESLEAVENFMADVFLASVRDGIG